MGKGILRFALNLESCLNMVDCSLQRQGPRIFHGSHSPGLSSLYSLPLISFWDTPGFLSVFKVLSWLPYWGLLFVVPVGGSSAICHLAAGRRDSRPHSPGEVLLACVFPPYLLLPTSSEEAPENKTLA